MGDQIQVETPALHFGRWAGPFEKDTMDFLWQVPDPFDARHKIPQYTLGGHNSRFWSPVVCEKKVPPLNLRQIRVLSAEPSSLHTGAMARAVLYAFAP